MYDTMSAAILLTNLISPLYACADEIPEPMTDSYMDEIIPPEPETEPPRQYLLTLAGNDSVAYRVDEEKIFHMDTGNKGSDIVLSYAARELVDFSFAADEQAAVTGLHLYNGKNEELPFSVEDSSQVSFLMPEDDLWFSVDTVLPVMEEEPAEIIPVEEIQPEETRPGGTYVGRTCAGRNCIGRTCAGRISAGGTCTGRTCTGRTCTGRTADTGTL